MNKFKYLVLFFSLTSCLFQKNKNNDKKKTFVESDKKVSITTNDSLEIQNLVRNVYKWQNKQPQLETCFNIGKKQEGQIQYVGVDWGEYKKNARLFKESGFFSGQFIINYKKTLEHIDYKVKNNKYEHLWNSGELPPFGTGANEWCHCQDVPIDNYWDKLEIRNVKQNKNSVSLIWSWGKGIEWEWLNDNKNGYPLEVIKENNKWKILSLDGFDTRYY